MMNIRKYKFIPWLFAGCILLFVQLGFTRTANESALKAEFIFRFIQYTTWPQPVKKEFYLCLLGESNVTRALERYSGRLVNGIPFTIVKPGDNDIPGGCNAVFITRKKRSQLRDWAHLYDSLPTLIISDVPGAFEENIDIALLTEPNRISFSINKTLAGLRMLEFSGQMLKLAKNVR